MAFLLHGRIWCWRFLVVGYCAAPPTSQEKISALPAPCRHHIRVCTLDWHMSLRSKFTVNSCICERTCLLVPLSLHPRFMASHCLLVPLSLYPCFMASHCLRVPLSLHPCFMASHCLLVPLSLHPCFMASHCLLVPLSLHSRFMASQLH